MTVEVVSYSEDRPVQFAHIANDLSRALDGIPIVAVEHVGSTAVPGLAAKPVLDIDVIVEREQVQAAPDDAPRRHVHVCVEGTLRLRSHLAVREVLRTHPDLRDRYGAVKLALSLDPDIDMATYIARRSDVLQEVLSVSNRQQMTEATPRETA
ncbi:MAG: GrpB family protein [Gordonia sp. (in: high G+C Gram-positive bacteria)]